MTLPGLPNNHLPALLLIVLRKSLNSNLIRNHTGHVMSPTYTQHRSPHLPHSLQLCSHWFGTYHDLSPFACPFTPFITLCVPNLCRSWEAFEWPMTSCYSCCHGYKWQEEAPPTKYRLSNEEDAGNGCTVGSGADWSILGSSVQVITNLRSGHNALAKRCNIFLPQLGTSQWPLVQNV